MERRQALRLLATAATVPLIPREMMALLRSARAQTKSASGPRTLSAREDRLVAQLAEIILPETDTPGAKSVKVNEFIDLILTEWCEDDERKRFLAGLSEVDARSAKLFGKDFLAASPEQQIEVVRQMDDEMASAELAKRNAGQSTREAADHAPDFFRRFKELTLIGYYTSEAGATRELHFEMMPGSYQGCVPLAQNPRKS